MIVWPGCFCVYTSNSILGRKLDGTEISFAKCEVPESRIRATDALVAELVCESCAPIIHYLLTMRMMAAEGVVKALGCAGSLRDVFDKAGH